MTRTEIRDLVKWFYSGRKRKDRTIITYGEIAPDIYFELSTAPAIVGDTFVFGVAVIEFNGNVMREITGKCKSCASGGLARKHIRALKVSYGTLKIGKGKVMTLLPPKKTEAPRKRGKSLQKLKRSA